MSSSRQLAAIMFTDIVGYTALMGEDEQKAFDLLRKNRQLQKPVIEKFNGTWIKEIGDGVLASFHTVIDAVLCASEIQESCESIDGLKLRIGIHLGDVMFEDNDVFGDGVNIASRLQALAPIGGIWVSESVYKNVSNKKEIKTKFVSEEVLKNVKEPVRIYEVIIYSKREFFDKSWAEETKKNLQKSIAVLPFVDMSPAHDQEYLGDGLAEELINLLSQIKELKVIGRTSSFSFKKKDVDLKTIGKTLSAETILEGSVQKAGNRIRITTQLISTEDGCHIWSQRYDRQIDDIFVLQDDICSKISEHLKVTLLKGHDTTTEKRPTRDLQAYEMFLKGDFYHKKYSAEGFTKAVEYFKKALGADPNYGDAWWSLGLTYFEKQAFDATPDLPGKIVMETAMEYAQKAITIDMLNSDAHFLLALIHFNYDYDWNKVASEIEIAKRYLSTPYPLMFLPLEPWYRATVHSDFNFAVQEFQKGVENDPLSILYLLHQALMHLHGLREYKKTRTILSRILELESHYSEAWRYMCLSYLFEGNYELAEECGRKFYDFSEGKGHGACNLILCLALSGKKEEAEELYQSAKETLSLSSFPASLHAKANAYLGRIDEAFEYLDKALEDKEYWLILLKFSPEWDLLRPDPRFRKVLERMHFPK